MIYTKLVKYLSEISMETQKHGTIEADWIVMCT